MNYIKRPELIKYVGRERVIERVIEKHSDPQPVQPTQAAPSIDINALANAIAQAIQASPLANRQTVANIAEEAFDNTKTLEKLAKSMTVQRGNSESNFGNLGNEHHTKTDKDETDKTIDLLSNLGD